MTSKLRPELVAPPRAARGPSSLLVALVAALLATLLIVPAARAADRLDVLADTLRERPLAIDSELSWLLDRGERARLERALRDSALTVRVAVVAQFEDDESGGDGARIAVALQQRLKRPGLYVVVDQHGYIDARAYAVPRRISFGYGIEQPPVSRKSTAGELIGRLERLVEGIEASPPGNTTDDLPLRELRPFGAPFGDGAGASTGDAALGSAIIGGMFGLLAGGIARFAARREAARASAAARRHRRGRRRR